MGLVVSLVSSFFSLLQSFSSRQIRLSRYVTSQLGYSLATAITATDMVFTSRHPGRQPPGSMFLHRPSTSIASARLPPFVRRSCVTSRIGKLSSVGYREWIGIHTARPDHDTDFEAAVRARYHPRKARAAWFTIETSPSLVFSPRSPWSWKNET